jgi:hypothetical protein
MMNARHDQVSSPDALKPVASPLVFSDRLLALAQDADRAGYRTTADRLVKLAHRVFDEAFRMPA